MTELKDCILAVGDYVTDGTRTGRVVVRPQWLRTTVLVQWDGMPKRTAKVCRISVLRPTRRMASGPT